MTVHYSLLLVARFTSIIMTLPKSLRIILRSLTNELSSIMQCSLNSLLDDKRFLSKMSMTGSAYSFRLAVKRIIS